jgi:hypothetical protein
MKHTMGSVLIAGFLVATADLKAAERRFDRVKSPEGPKAKVVLATGPELFAVGNFGSPPPAPANDPVLQAPTNDSVFQAPGNDAVIIPPAPLPPVAAPGTPSLVPLPEPAPGSVAAGGPPLQLAPAPALFPHVKYRDRRHIAPCAVPMYVAVRDPCERRDRCSCGPPKLVLVEICVPPGMPKITCRHDGTRVRYDYGQYAVNVTSRHGVVVVNYDR